MEKTRYKVILCWQGETHTFHTTTTASNIALKFAIIRLAQKVGYSGKSVRDYIMKPEKRRWEVTR